MFNTKKLLNKHNIKPNPMKDQFLLNDWNTVKRMIDLAELNQNDVVLEIGAGTGNLTCEIAKQAGKVITFEIDKRFKPILNQLPDNVEIHYKDAWNYVQLHGKLKKRKEYNKIVSSPPYSFLEPFLHNLTFLIYDKVILLVPIKFVDSIQNNPIFGSFFQPKLKFTVDKDKFFPQPKTLSSVIDLKKLPDPLKTKNLGLFLRQYIYQHEQQLVKNSLMEGLIKYNHKINSNMLTKNKARKIIGEKKLPNKYLENTPNSAEIYFLIEKVFT
jgi:16S rRNA (adenine1518-N6/adenine1519-N6)-dimethyltransferase